MNTSESGIVIDQVDGGLYFGGSKGRFDHCTDLGPVDFNSVTSADTDLLIRKREDTELHLGHVYVYESNIYEPERRTEFTGHNVRYAKILVESIEVADTIATLIFEPTTPTAGKKIQVSFRPGSDGLDGAISIHAYWAAYDVNGNSLLIPRSSNEQKEFPARPRGSDGNDFNLGRKRCLAQEMEMHDAMPWTCDILLPKDAALFAIIFIDDLGRTSQKGIRSFQVAPRHH